MRRLLNPVGFAAGQLAVFQGAGSVQNVLQKRAGHGKRLEVTKQPTMKRTTTRTFISIAFVSAKTMEMEVRPVGTSRDRSNIGGGVSLLLRVYILLCTVCFTPMRFPRVKAEGQSFCYCVSRVVDRQFIFLGIRIVLAQSDAVSWKEVSRQYRNDLFVHGSTKNKQPAFDLATAQRSLTSNRA